MTEPDGPSPDVDASGGFWDLLKMKPAAPSREEGGPGRVVLRVSREHLRSLGLLHGGVAAAMLDSVMGRAASETSPPGHFVVTIQLNVHFIRAAREDETLVADAVVQHSGRRTAVVRGEIQTDAGVLVATGSGTFMHLPLPESGTEGRDGERS